MPHYGLFSFIKVPMNGSSLFFYARASFTSHVSSETRPTLYPTSVSAIPENWFRRRHADWLLNRNTLRSTQYRGDDSAGKSVGRAERVKRYRCRCNPFESIFLQTDKKKTYHTSHGLRTKYSPFQERISLMISNEPTQADFNPSQNIALKIFFLNFNFVSRSLSSIS